MCHGNQWWIKVLALFGALFCIPCSCAEQVDPLRDVSYEVKFLLDADAVLTDQHLPTEALTERFSLKECRRIDVIYLETADRAFNNEGWVNRLRWKSWKKKPERTYKKRYAVDGMDQSAILAALERIRADGLDVASEGGTLEIDWGYSKMTLSATWEVTEKYGDLQSLSQFNTGDAIACAASTMPAQEVNWKRDGWGLEAISRAQKIGPLQLFRAKGSWEETELTLDIVFFKVGSAPVAELSFKTDDYQTALEKRNDVAHLPEQSLSI